jgi:transcriptional regulator with XRE-family HTH domain
MSEPTSGSTEHIGKRVARIRKRRGLTQNGLAQRASYSRGLIAQVEAGHKVATPSFVAAVAEAMTADPAEIYGQPYHARGADDRVHAAIPELRRVLAYVDIGPELAGPPRPLERLAAEAATARRLIHKARLLKLGAMLPALIEELTWWAYETDDPKAWALLSRANGSAVSLTRRLGYSGDALAFLERGADAARRSGDPHLPMLVTLARSLLLVGMNQTRPALTLLDRASQGVQEGRKDSAELAGALFLRSAIVAARAHEDSRAWDYHGQADELVKRGGKVTNVYGLEFTPANVDIHGAAVAVEVGDLDEASRRDRQIGDLTLKRLPNERRAHHEIDMARANVETGDYERALDRIESAEKTAPQMTYFHPSARTVVDHLVDVRRTLPESLRRLHERMSA